MRLHKLARLLVLVLALIAVPTASAIPGVSPDAYVWEFPLPDGIKGMHGIAFDPTTEEATWIVPTYEALLRVRPLRSDPKERIEVLFSTDTHKQVNAYLAQSWLFDATGVKVDPADGKIYWVTTKYNLVLGLAKTGEIAVIAGTHDRRAHVDDKDATKGKLSAPIGLAIGRDGTLYVADQYNSDIRVISPADKQGQRSLTTLQLKAEVPSRDFVGPAGICVNPVDGSLMVNSNKGNVHRLSRPEKIAGHEVECRSYQFQSTWVTHPRPERQDQTYFVSDIGILADGTALVVDNGLNRVLAYSPDIQAAPMTFIEGDRYKWVDKAPDRKSRSDNPARLKDTILHDPFGISVMPSGAVVLVDGQNQRILYLDLAGKTAGYVPLVEKAAAAAARGDLTEVEKICASIGAIGRDRAALAQVITENALEVSDVAGVVCDYVDPLEDALHASFARYAIDQKSKASVAG